MTTKTLTDRMIARTEADIAALEREPDSPALQQVLTVARRLLDDLRKAKARELADLAERADGPVRVPLTANAQLYLPEAEGVRVLTSTGSSVTFATRADAERAREHFSGLREQVANNVEIAVAPVAELPANEQAMAVQGWCTCWATAEQRLTEVLDGAPKRRAQLAPGELEVIKDLRRGW